MHRRDATRELLADQIVLAPMAGGPSTAELVLAVTEAGALGFLAGGYKTAAAMRAEIAAVRAATDRPFGVNVFLPGAPSAEPAALAAYARSLERDAARVAGAAIGDPSWDDDDWDAKLDVLADSPPALTSFTFGCPPREVIAAIQGAGGLVAVTVTTPIEAELATRVGADCLAVQGFEGGAHRGSFANDDEPGQDYGLLSLIAAVARVSDLPQLAAGGIAGPRGVAAVLAAGASCAQLGTLFLRCPESGAPAAHKRALADPRFTDTAITRAFSGRRARSLSNRFMREHPDAPAAYPEVNNATRPLRAAAALEDPEHMSLYAGQGYRAATERGAGEIAEELLAASIRR